MDTNRKCRLGFAVALLLLATGASAQTIYKQVDENGRVIFTDQPSPSARVVTSYETNRASRATEEPARAESVREPARAEPRAEAPAPVQVAGPTRNAFPARDVDPEAMPDSPRRPAEAEPARRVDNPYANWRRVSPASEAAVTRRTESPSPPMAIVDSRPAAPAPVPATPVSQASSAQAPQVASLQPMQGGVLPAQAAARSANDVERAVNTYTALNTPLAAQVDANEAARAKQQMNKSIGGPVLVVQAAPRDHEEASSKKSGIGGFYFLWVGTFLVLAAGLLYVAWQVFRLIMGNAFPRWRLGVG